MGKRGPRPSGLVDKTLRIEPDLWDRVGVAAKRNRATKSRWVREAIVQRLEWEHEDLLKDDGEN